MPNSSDAPTAPITSFVADLDHLAAEAMADWKVPGAALAVVQDGKVVLTRAYGQRDVEANLPVTPGTQFAILSITKSFTVAALTAAGVKRISLATSLYKAAMTGLLSAAKEVREQGTFGYIDTSISSPDMNAFLRE